MAIETYMDIPSMEVYATRFSEMGNTVTEISKNVEGFMAQLRDSAFTGKIGDSLYSYWSSQLKPELDKLGAKFTEIGLDITGAIKAYRDNDFSGSQHFVGGGAV